MMVLLTEREGHSRTFSCGGRFFVFVITGLIGWEVLYYVGQSVMFVQFFMEAVVVYTCTLILVNVPTYMGSTSILCITEGIFAYIIILSHLTNYCMHL